MTTIRFPLKASILIAAVSAFTFAHAATTTKAEYKAGKERVEAQYKADKKACDSLAGNAKDICEDEAEGKEKVAKAELEYAHTGKAEDQTKILKARADANYEVAKEKCDDLAGNPKDVCEKEAKAAHVKALADAKMGQQVGEAKMDAAEDKRKADYQVAAEKCDALSGDAKSSCMATAKARYKM